MKTIAQQLGITEFPFMIKDKNGKQIYHENSDGGWEKMKYDVNGKEIYYENSNGIKRKYDADTNRIFYENSNGKIISNRPKEIVELTLDQIAEKMGLDVNQLRIKD